MAIRRAKQGLKVHPKSKFPAYDLELLQWRLDVQNKIKQYRKEFWESQREVEDRWIAKYNFHAMHMHERGLIERRESIIRISKHTSNLVTAIKAEADSQSANMQRRAAKERAHYLWTEKHIKSMNLNVRNWLTPEHLEANLKDTLVLPASIDQSTFYSQLREQALLAEKGKIISETDYFNNRDDTLLRNLLLVPLFNDLKSQIKFLTYTPAHALEIDYEASLQMLLESGKAEEEELKQLRQKYVEVYQASLALNKKPDVFLVKAQKQLNLLLQLLNTWSEYVGVLKLDDTQAAALAEAHFPETNTKKGRKSVPVEPESDDYAFDSPKELKNPRPEETEDFEEEDSATMAERSEVAESKLRNINLSTGSIFEEVLAKHMSQKLEADFSMYSGEPESLEDEEIPSANKFESRSVMELLINTLRQDDAINTPQQLFSNAYEFPEPEGLKPKERNIVHNPSFTLEALREKVASIPDVDLSDESAMQRLEILRSIESLNSFKCDEPQLLLKIFELHRYKPIKFAPK